MDILIKNALVIDPKSSFHNKRVSVLVKNGVIEEIGENIEEKDIKVVSFENLCVSNGWMDSSVSFGEPGFEERETIANGLEVARKSGFTHVMLNPNTYPVIDNQALVSFVNTKAFGAVTSLCSIGALTKNQEGTDLAELFDMKNAGAVAFGDYKKSLSNANLLKIGLQYVQDFDGIIIAYSNDSTIKGKGVVHEGVVSTRLGLKGIPSLAEELIVARNLFLLEYTGGKLHIPTISTIKSVDLIREAKQRGLDVTCSVAVHQLVLTDEVLEDFDTRFKVNPPLRDEKTRKYLIEAVLDGTIDMITSDHQPLDIEHKKLEFDLAKDGTIGLETAFGALMNMLPVEVIVEKFTAAHQRFLGKNPSIQKGEKACLTLFSTEGVSVFQKENSISKSKNSAFLGRELKGKIFGVFNNNKWRETNE